MAGTPWSQKRWRNTDCQLLGAVTMIIPVEERETRHLTAEGKRVKRGSKGRIIDETKGLTFNHIKQRYS